MTSGFHWAYCPLLLGVSAAVLSCSLEDDAASERLVYASVFRDPTQEGGEALCRSIASPSLWTDCVTALAVGRPTAEAGRAVCELVLDESYEDCIAAVDGAQEEAPTPCVREDADAERLKAPTGRARMLAPGPFAELVVPPHTWDSGMGAFVGVEWVLYDRAPMGGLWLAPWSGLPRFEQPQGLVLLDADGAPAESALSRPKWDRPSWTFVESGVLLALPGDDEPGAGWTLGDPAAAVEHAPLNFARSGSESAAEFAPRTAAIGPGHRSQGLLLPAPGVASWELRVPARGQLHFSALLLQPEPAPILPSDGATLRMEVAVGGATHLLVEGPLTDSRLQTQCVDLSEWSGQAAVLRITTEPRDTTTSDYVFLAEPRVTAPQARSTELILVQVDGMTADSLTPFGAAADRTPALARWAEEAALYTLSGSDEPIEALLRGVSARLMADGWVTGALLEEEVGTADWGSVRVSSNNAAEQIEAALAWQRTRLGANTALWVQLGDLQPPYQEPFAYRHLFVSQPSLVFDDELALRPPVSAAGSAYLAGRYAGALRYVDTELEELLGRQGPEDWAVVFSEDVWMVRGPRVGSAPPAGVPTSAGDLMSSLLTGMGVGN